MSRAPKSQPASPPAGAPATSDVAAPSRRLAHVDLSRLEREPNHRHRKAIDTEAIARLARELADPKVGQLVPILVAERPDGRQVLIDGARRVAAAEAAQIPTLIAEVRVGLSDGEIEAVRALANIEREGITPVGEMLAVQALVGRLRRASPPSDDPVQAAADFLGRDRRWVADRMVLDRVCDRAIDLAVADHLTLGHLRELAKVGDLKEQAEMANRACSMWGPVGRSKDAEVRRVTIEELAGWVRNAQRDLKRVPWLVDQPFAQKPACLNCNHNTATDEGLFGVTPIDGHPGFCMNPGCFAVKERASQRAIEKAVEKCVDAGVADLATVQAKAPVYVKAATVQRKAKAALQPKEKPAEAADPDEGGGRHGGGVDTKLRNAVQKFQNAESEWWSTWARAMKARIEADPRLALCLYVVNTNDAILKANETKHSAWGQPPAPQPAVSVKLLDLLDRVNPAAPTLEGLASALPSTGKGYGWADAAAEVLAQCTIAAVGKIAEFFGVTDLPAPPVWEDFVPRDKTAHQAKAAEAAANPKPKKRKTGQKGKKQAAAAE